MKKNFGILGAVSILAIVASSMGCSSGHYRADRDEYNQYNGTQAQRDAYRTDGREMQHYAISPPPELVAAGVADPSGLNSTSTEGLRRTSDLVSPPPELTSTGVSDRSGLSSGTYGANTYNTSTTAPGYADRTGMDRTVAGTTAMGAAAGTAAVRDDRMSHDKAATGMQIGKTAVLTFSAGDAAITDAEKAKLHEIVAAIGADNIKRVEVAAWSDKAFPRSGNDLPKGDRDLADRRADNINDYLKKEDDLSFMRIRTYSMAETSNWLARMFRTDEAELKSVFSRENEAPMAREDFNTILNEGGPSKAVLVFIRK